MRCEQRARSRSRSEWGASARESVPAGDTGRSTSRIACRERVTAGEQAYGPDHSKAAESDAQKVARRGDEVAVNIADYFNDHLATPDLQGAALTPATGRHTLAGVDALKVVAALNFSEPDDDQALLCRLAAS